MKLKRMGRWGIGMLIALLALSAAWAGLAEASPEVSAVKPHNYILIIDNSLSTSGRHSLGGATDPRGLRFDAAQLVYQNVVSAAELGSRGKLGVIVFCGPKNCVTYGPLDIDDKALDDRIGRYLNAAANQKRRDVYTDIRTALAKCVPEKKVINYHAFRNTLIPLVTMLGGSLPGLFSGALITETLFSIRGIGYASYTSMTQGDIPFIMFYLAFISILTLLGNLISDLLYAVVDPRVRLS